VFGPLASFAAGAVSSVGPCVAPRFIALAGLAAGKPRAQAARIAGAFVAGLTLVYAAFGAIATLLGLAAQLSTYTYWILAALLGLAGLISLWRADAPCVHAQVPAANGSVGGAFLLGSAFGLVISPCCAPVAVAIAAYAASSGKFGYGALLLSCFALGHALPILGAGLGAQSVSAVLQRYTVRQAASVVSAALMLALGIYYAVLA
jgi:cytochrome c biogenesis protein CcdA